MFGGSEIFPQMARKELPRECVPKGFEKFEAPKDLAWLPLWQRSPCIPHDAQSLPGRKGARFESGGNAIQSNGWGVGDVLMCFYRTWKMILLMAEILIGSFSHCLQGFSIASGAGFFSFHQSCSMWLRGQSWIDVSGWKVGRLGKYLPNTDVFQAKWATKCVIILFLDTRVLCMFLEVKRCTTPWVRCRAGVSCKVKGKPHWSCSLPISVRSIRRMPSLLPQL